MARSSDCGMCRVSAAEPGTDALPFTREMGALLPRVEGGPVKR